jgi:hypothetical protein
VLPHSSTSPHSTPVSLPSRGFQLVPVPTRPRRHNPLELWHLYSLDAPTVATLWTWFIAHTYRIDLPLTSIAAIAVAVWLLYAADRLLDSRSLTQQPVARNLEARHRFHHGHRRIFVGVIAAACVVMAFLLPQLSPDAIRLYLVEGSFLVGYFVIIHATSSAHRLPKELAVGPFFSAAIFIPSIARLPALRMPLLPDALLLAALCSLNCIFIYAWEHPATYNCASETSANLWIAQEGSASPTHPATRFCLRHLRSLATIVFLSAGALSVFHRQHLLPIPACIAIATILLLTLHQLRHYIPATTLRAAADLALLTPLLFCIHF